MVVEGEGDAFLPFCTSLLLLSPTSSPPPVTSFFGFSGTRMKGVGADGGLDGVAVAEKGTRRFGDFRAPSFSFSGSQIELEKVNHIIRVPACPPVGPFIGPVSVVPIRYVLLLVSSSVSSLFCFWVGLFICVPTCNKWRG